MRFILLLFLVVSLCTEYNKAQISPGAKDISLANSSSPVSDDVFSIFNNPAGLAETVKREFGIFYSPAPFGFTEMANTFACYAEPFNWGTAAAGFMSYGFSLYRETRITAGASYKYSEAVLLGSTLNMHNIKIERYGSASAFYMDAGAIVYLTNDIRTGFFVHNLNNASFKNYKDQIPVVLNTGVGVDFENASLSVSAEKDTRYKFSLSAGLAYFLTDNFTLRAGFGNEPNRYSGGIGIRYSFVTFDYAVFNHSELGLTHQFGILLDFNK